MCPQIVLLECVWRYVFFTSFSPLHLSLSPFLLSSFVSSPRYFIPFLFCYLSSSYFPFIIQFSFLILLFLSPSQSYRPFFLLSSVYPFSFLSFPPLIFFLLSFFVSSSFFNSFITVSFLRFSTLHPSLSTSFPFHFSHPLTPLRLSVPFHPHTLPATSGLSLSLPPPAYLSLSLTSSSL